MRETADSFFEFMAIMVGITQLIVIVVFFIRLKYIRQAKLIYWGIGILLNVAFMLMAFATAKLLGMDTTHNVYLFANILLISDLGFGILTYQQHKQINKNVLWAVFGIFILLWLIEFTLNIQQNGLQNIDRLRVTGIFMHVIFVAGAWLYLLDLFKNPFTEFRKIPFFWIVIGWLFFYILTSATLFTGLTDATKLPVLLMFDWTVLAENIANILYAIAFWKTKSWVLKNGTI